MENTFTNCKFDNVGMAGADFTQCDLIQPKFHEVRCLKSVILSESKICNSKKCVEVDSVDDVSKIVEDLKD